MVTYRWGFVDGGLYGSEKAFFHHDSQVVKLMILVDLEQPQQPPSASQASPQAPSDGAPLLLLLLLRLLHLRTKDQSQF